MAVPGAAVLRNRSPWRMGSRILKGPFVRESSEAKGREARDQTQEIALGKPPQPGGERPNAAASELEVRGEAEVHPSVFILPALSPKPDPLRGVRASALLGEAGTFGFPGPAPHGGREPRSPHSHQRAVLRLGSKAR
jgi:hypothetical protein